MDCGSFLKRLLFGCCSARGPTSPSHQGRLCKILLDLWYDQHPSDCPSQANPHFLDERINLWGYASHNGGEGSCPNPCYQIRHVRRRHAWQMLPVPCSPLYSGLPAFRLAFANGLRMNLYMVERLLPYAPQPVTVVCKYILSDLNPHSPKVGSVPK